MRQLMKGKSGLLMTPLFWVSRASSAIAGPWSRGFPPLNSWPCPPFFSWNQGWFNPVLTVLLWAAVVGLCVLVVNLVFFRKRRNPRVSAPSCGLSMT